MRLLLRSECKMINKSKFNAPKKIEEKQCYWH
jgi:hypothetical protein